MVERSLVRLGETNVLPSTPFDEMDVLLQDAALALGCAHPTTHEAREYYRREGRAGDDERLHALLIRLAAGPTGPSLQDVSSAPK